MFTVRDMLLALKGSFKNENFAVRPTYSTIREVLNKRKQAEKLKSRKMKEG